MTKFPPGICTYAGVRRVLLGTYFVKMRLPMGDARTLNILSRKVAGLMLNSRELHVIRAIKKKNVLRYAAIPRYYSSLAYANDVR